MRTTRTAVALLVAAALAAAVAAPATTGAPQTRPGGTALEETTDYYVFVLGLRSLVDEVHEAGRAAVGPPGEASRGPAAALVAGLDQVEASSGRPPFTVVNAAACRFSLRFLRRGADRLTRAADLAGRGPSALAESSQRAARAMLRTGSRLERSCLAVATRRRARLVALQPAPRGTVRITGLAFSRTAPLVPVIARAGTLTGAACPPAAGEALGVVVAYDGVAAGATLQVAFGRFPGTGAPTVSAGVAVAAGAGTAAAQVPAPVAGLATGAADGEYVAYVALNGRPMSGARFTIDCA